MDTYINTNIDCNETIKTKHSLHVNPLFPNKRSSVLGHVVVCI